MRSHYITRDWLDFEVSYRPGKLNNLWTYNLFFISLNVLFLESIILYLSSFVTKYSCHVFSLITFTSSTFILLAFKPSSSVFTLPRTFLVYDSAPPPPPSPVGPSCDWWMQSWRKRVKISELNLKISIWNKKVAPGDVSKLGEYFGGGI